MHTYSGADKVLRSDLDANCFDMRSGLWTFGFGGSLDCLYYVAVHGVPLKLGRAWVALPDLCGFLLSFSFFGGFCCTCFLFLLVSLLVVAWLAVCVSLCMGLCVCVYVGVFT